jgi:DNA-binding NtrC family response regulator
MIGDSPQFRSAVALLRRFASCDAPVLIEGETGTGKELAAREIHYSSARQGQPFIPVNCGALPDALIEDELFGHVRGAFTDARTGREGLVEIAGGGTLFLDEVDTLAAKGQVTLLRFLQDRRYRSVGSTETRTTDVRVVAASNSQLSELVERGSFRRDLLYRLNTLRVRLPALRERIGDVPLLCSHFLRSAALNLNRPLPSLTPEAQTALIHHPWPGNIRELESVIFRAVLLADGRAIGMSILDLPASTQSSEARAEGDDGASSSANSFERFGRAKSRAIAAFEVGYLTEAIRRSNGSITLAAKLSGTERRQLGKLLKKHGLVSGPRDTGPS